MICCQSADGPPWGTCSCGWPLFRNGYCSNSECQFAWALPDLEDDEPEEDEEE